MSQIGARYRRFRSAKRSEWYLKQSYKNNEIVQQELDAILLELLKGTRELLNSKTIWSKRDEAFWSPLLSVAQLHRNQVLVDEATDFSAIQLACMYSLSQPRVNSFFACGDFNQRLTTWGAKNTDEFKWVLPQIKTKNITISYRQSVELNDLAKKIIQSVSGEAPHIELPNGTIEGHVKPSLLENDISPTADMYDWLSARIIEIERQLGFMPSTAIFVTSEETVDPFASKLAQKLEDHNINVSPCLRGEVIGEDTDIRVFDIQHIKGLEFEAVFFVNVDELAELHPTLFDKYLYVGITRAASYLGITCATQLPEKIRALRSDFVSDWA